MTILEAIQERHSVRHYLDKPLADEVISVLTEEIAICNAESGLHIQLVTNEPKAFGGFVSHYGFFKGVTSYFAMIGPKGPDLEEKCGYYGEQLVLKAQQLGLNTCWVAATYSKVPEAFEIGQDEKLVVIIALGYGKTQGSAHKSKAAEAVSNISSNSPAWFKNGVAAALLAPTAINQQKFYLQYVDGKVSAKAKLGPCSKIDLGIVKYHFEVGAGKENFEWK